MLREPTVDDYISAYVRTADVCSRADDPAFERATAAIDEARGLLGHESDARSLCRLGKVACMHEVVQVRKVLFDTHQGDMLPEEAAGRVATARLELSGALNITSSLADPEVLEPCERQHVPTILMVRDRTKLYIRKAAIVEKVLSSDNQSMLPAAILAEAAQAASGTDWGWGGDAIARLEVHMVEALNARVRGGLSWPLEVGSRLLRGGVALGRVVAEDPLGAAPRALARMLPALPGSLGPTAAAARRVLTDYRRF